MMKQSKSIRILLWLRILLTRAPYFYFIASDQYAADYRFRSFPCTRFTLLFLISSLFPIFQLFSEGLRGLIPLHIEQSLVCCRFLSKTFPIGFGLVCYNSIQRSIAAKKTLFLPFLYLLAHPFTFFYTFFYPPFQFFTSMYSRLDVTTIPFLQYMFRYIAANQNRTDVAEFAAQCISTML